MTVIVDFGVQVIIDMSKSTTKIYVGSFSDAEPDVFQDETGTQISSRTVVISNTVKKLKCAGRKDGIGGNELSGQLNEVVFGNDVYEIEDSAFKNCGTLSSFKLNRNIRKLGSQSFSGCSGIMDVDLSGNIFDEIGENVFSGLGIKTLKTQLASRSFGAFDIFSDCVRLSSADIRSNFIPSGCFAYCPNLKSAKFTFSNIITRQNSIYGDTVSTDTLFLDDVSASFQDSPFIGCENLENASIIGFSELNFGTLVQGLSKLSSLVIDDECSYTVNDECFADNASLTEFNFGRNITIDRFSENALSAASLTSINLAGIKYDELTSIDKLEVQRSEDVVQLSDEQYRSYTFSTLDFSDYPVSHTVTLKYAPTPYQLYNQYFPGKMDGKKLYYGCIYNDISACCRFCVENHIPLITIFSDCVPCAYKYGEDIRIFGGNANAYHYAQVEMSKLSPNDTVNPVGGLAETGFERNDRPNGLILKSNDPRSRGQWTFEKKLTYEWIRQQPYIFCIRFTDRNLKTGEINKYGNSISGLIPKIPKGIVNKYDIENDKFQSEFFTPTGGTSILGDPVPLNHYMYSTRFSNCYMFKPNKNSTYKYSSYEEFKYNFSVNGKSYLTYEYPWIYSEDITWPKMFDFFNIKYDKNIPENELRFKYRNEIEKICRKWKAPSGTGLREAYKKALNYLSNYDNNNIYYHEIRYANAEQHLRLNLRAFDSACKLAFENYKRDPKFNYPGYIEKKLDLSYLPIKYSTKTFNCWGIGHDCIIQTADGVRCRWDFKRQKLIKL